MATVNTGGVSEPEERLLYFKFSAVRLKISSWIYHWEPLLRSVHILFKPNPATQSHLRHSTFPPFLFSKTLVLQTLMRANAMTQAGCLSLSPSPVFFLSLALPLSVFRRRWVNHMVRLVQSQKIMGSYSSLSFAYQSFIQKQKASSFNSEEIRKTRDKSTSLDNYIMYGF